MCRLTVTAMSSVSMAASADVSSHVIDSQPVYVSWLCMSMVGAICHRKYVAWQVRLLPSSLPSLRRNDPCLHKSLENRQFLWQFL